MKTFVKYLMLCSLLWVGVSCNDSDPDSVVSPNPPTVDLASFRGKLAAHTAINIIIPGYESLRERSEALEAAIIQFTSTPSAAHLQEARSALKNAWLNWQEVAPFMFGPAESNALRNALNTYPANADLIERNIETGEYILSSIGNRDAIGFPAMDYLLNGLGDASSTTLAYQQDASRANYLNELAQSAAEKVAATLDDWKEDGGNFVGTFTASSAQGTDVGSALGLLVNGIDLHYQRFARDGKIAIPAGIRSAGVPRPKAVEALYGGYSVELLQASMEAYKKIFQGVGRNEIDQEGLLDYLDQLEAVQLSDDIEAQWTGVINQIATLKDPLNEQIGSDLDSITNVFLEMQKLVPLIKADMASLMGITLTNQDNDGD